MTMRKVLYEGWEMECCGEPFSVGDEVDWELSLIPDEAGWPADALSEVDGERGLLAYIGHIGHSAVGVRMRGRVAGIQVVKQRYVEHEPGSRMFHPVPGEVWLRPVDRAPKWFGHETDSGTGPGGAAWHRSEQSMLVELDGELLPSAR
ncbi:hypothetical protein DY218_33320 [Streptomyces triticagri]|uniref:Uncharacterized protein n=1 Tax=Streptomyces triticagri TaxID=2293568 RepID=A0A372LUR9_9ACTN|nr:DUF6578 domain-containing protein [Streptomyces triticagri]RFU82381.1 hypothetical protein DY218_33320 [Streptomyces triticagri]